MINPYHIDKTKTFFGLAPTDDKAHAYYRHRQLCTSVEKLDALPVADQYIGPTCSQCLELFNIAVHDAGGAYYGGHHGDGSA
jgi:hypothetical protein